MKQNLMIVAHPDDEIIFGFPSLHNINFVSEPKVVSVTNADHPGRSLEFQTCMKRLGVQDYDMYNYKDEWDNSFENTDIKERLQDLIFAGKYKQIITHNANGEYGHSQHKALNQIINQLVTDQELWVFEQLDHALDFHNLKWKLDILQDVYKSQYNIGTFDWHHPTNRQNNMMEWITKCGIKRIK